MHPDAHPGWRPLTDSGELDRLSPEQLFLRVRPLLRKAGLCSNAERLQRLLQNLPSACAELAAAWRQDPRLDDAPVAFGDYLAARLASHLHQLDQEHYPELYDQRRRYQPDAAPDPLPDDSDTQAPPATARLSPAADSRRNWRQALQNTLRSQRIHPASQAALLSAMDGLEHGDIDSPYRLQRALGHKPDQARFRPATSTYLIARDLIDHDLLFFNDTATTEKARPPFSFDPDVL